MHNTSPISSTSDITPFLLVCGLDAPSPESIFLALPPKPLPPDHYAKHIISRMTDAHNNFAKLKLICFISSVIFTTKRAHVISIPDGKILYLRNDSPSLIRGLTTRFIHNFDGPYTYSYRTSIWPIRFTNFTQYCLR